MMAPVVLTRNGNLRAEFSLATISRQVDFDARTAGTAYPARVEGEGLLPEADGTGRLFAGTGPERKCRIHVWHAEVIARERRARRAAKPGNEQTNGPKRQTRKCS